MIQDHKHFMAKIICKNKKIVRTKIRIAGNVSKLQCDVGGETER